MEIAPRSFRYELSASGPYVVPFATLSWSAVYVAYLSYVVVEPGNRSGARLALPRPK